MPGPSFSQPLNPLHPQLGLGVSPHSFHLFQISLWEEYRLTLPHLFSLSLSLTSLWLRTLLG